MKDSVGQPFNAYVRVNHEKGKFDFYRWNPDKAQSKVKEITPSTEHQTQVAVNSNGKTVEAVKNIQQPLHSGQSQPNESQVQKQQKQKTEPKQARSRGKNKGSTPVF
jgi:hypothetical protein